ncbi:hypothetical protein [Pseudomonas synxantha]|uniref:hypothetical protein n=1 Tax=Pseudomonas synxantha TaxID=47883 RepID=UPI000F566D28|nr:hypothetical protein [Pseudomonas synxantha]AZE78043.1 hypothetical protein C4J99_2258 [Pseudomonas synxantha]
MGPVDSITEILLSNDPAGTERENARGFLRFVNNVHNTPTELFVFVQKPTVSAALWQLAILTLSSISSSAGPWLGPSGAVAASLQNSMMDNLFKSHIESLGYVFLSKGVENIEEHKQKFLTRTIRNGISLLTSVIESLEGNASSLLDSKLAKWGADSSIRPRLLENYKSMHAVLLWMMDDGGRDVYLVESYDSSDLADAINLVQDGQQRIAFSLQFFKKCAVPAVNALLHEVAHLCCNKFDFYYLARDSSCLDEQHAELPLHRQIKDFAKGFERSTERLAEQIGGEEFLPFFAPKDNTRTLAQLYNEDADTKVMVDYMNADWVSALAIVIADFNLRHGGDVPLKRTSPFKSPAEGGLYVES